MREAQGQFSRCDLACGGDAARRQRQPAITVPALLRRGIRRSVIARLQQHKLPAIGVNRDAKELAGLEPAFADKAQLRLKSLKSVRRVILA